MLFLFFKRMIAMFLTTTSRTYRRSRQAAIMISQHSFRHRGEQKTRERSWWWSILLMFSHSDYVLTRKELTRCSCRHLLLTTAVNRYTQMRSGEWRHSCAMMTYAQWISLANVIQDWPNCTFAHTTHILYATRDMYPTKGKKIPYARIECLYFMLIHVEIIYYVNM